MASDKELFHSGCDDVECCALDSGLVDMTVPGQSMCGCSVPRNRDGLDFECDVTDICTE